MDLRGSYISFFFFLVFGSVSHILFFMHRFYAAFLYPFSWLVDWWVAYSMAFQRRKRFDRGY